MSAFNNGIATVAMLLLVSALTAIIVDVARRSDDSCPSAVTTIAKDQSRVGG